jgi:hypothetical protein
MIENTYGCRQLLPRVRMVADQDANAEKYYKALLLILEKGDSS